MRPVVSKKVAKAVSTNISGLYTICYDYLSRTVDLVNLLLSVSQDGSLHPSSRQEFPASDHVGIPCYIDQVRLPVHSPRGKFGDVGRMNIEKQSVSICILVKCREFGRTADPLVAADIQEVGEERSSGSQYGDAERSKEFDGSRLRVHLFISRFVRIERKINLGCCRDGCDGLATVDNGAGRYHRATDVLRCCIGVDYRCTWDAYNSW